MQLDPERNTLILQGVRVLSFARRKGYNVPKIFGLRYSIIHSNCIYIDHRDLSARISSSGTSSIPTKSWVSHANPPIYIHRLSFIPRVIPSRRLQCSG